MSLDLYLPSPNFIRVSSANTLHGTAHAAASSRYSFYEAARQVTPTGRGSEALSEHTSSERAQPLQPAKGCARERVIITGGRQTHSSSLSLSEVTHPFIRALRGTSCAGAREDPREGQRPLMHGSQQRPHEYARLPLRR